MLFGVAVNTAGNERKGDAEAVFSHGQAEGFCVGGAQQPATLVRVGLAVDWSDGMDDVLGGQTEARRNGRVAGFDRGHFVGSRLELVCTCRSEDGTGNPAAHGEAGIGGIDDGVDGYFGNILTDEGEGHWKDPFVASVFNKHIYFLENMDSVTSMVGKRSGGGLK